jgi:hypothetical protein
VQLRGWQLIVYQIIENHFNNEFDVGDIYEFQREFKKVYPDNFHIEDKIRQVLQQLRDKGLIDFLDKGSYRKIQQIKKIEITIKPEEEFVYLFANDAIPEWLKIGRTNSIERRLKELYNTSIPLPFKHLKSIKAKTLKQSSELERSIHNIIDTINPAIRLNTIAKKREFFQLSQSQGVHIFELVEKIMNIEKK